MCDRVFVGTVSTAQIKIYITVVPFPRSRARNLGSPAGFPAKKPIFVVSHFHRSFLVVLRTHPEGFRDHI